MKNILTGNFAIVINVQKAIIGYIIAVLFFVAVNYSFLKIAPMSYWVKYNRIDFIAPIVSGHVVKMISHSHWNIPVDQSTISSLFCAADRGRFEYAGQTKTEHASFQPKEDSRLWNFLEVPEWADRCYVESTVTLHLDFGIKKTKLLKSSTVKVVHNKAL